jgi:hypothetical protein
VTPARETGVVWVDNRSKDVFFQRFGPEGGAILGAPVNVSRSPEIFSSLWERASGRDLPAMSRALATSAHQRAGLQHLFSIRFFKR